MASTNVHIALVSTGSRGLMFVNGIAQRPGASLVALCEPNTVRAEYYIKHLEQVGRMCVPVYKPDQFTEMLKAENVGTVVVTCIDVLHNLYIVPTLEARGTYNQSNFRSLKFT